jgi:hypothetical protein
VHSLRTLQGIPKQRPAEFREGKQSNPSSALVMGWHFVYKNWHPIHSGNSGNEQGCSRVFRVAGFQKDAG